MSRLERRASGPLWEEYVVQTLAPSSGAPRVLDVRSSEDWLELVTSWPRPAPSETVRLLADHTGLRGTWVLPDWAAVGQRWDAVHLSVGAWARTAGVVRSVGHGPTWTLCAGWGPDATFWLTSQPTVAGERILWTLTPEVALEGVGG